MGIIVTLEKAVAFRSVSNRGRCSETRIWSKLFLRLRNSTEGERRTHANACEQYMLYYCNSISLALSENSGLESLLLTDSDLLRRFKIRGFLDQTGDNMTSVLKGKGNYEALEKKKHYLFHISFLM